MKISLRILSSLLVCCSFLQGAELMQLELSDSKVTLKAPANWMIKKENGETGIYPPNQPAKGLKSRIHLARLREQAETLDAAIESELSRITERSPDSSNDRNHYKGSSPVKTDSGIQGLIANFHTESANEPGVIKRHEIVKYYFQDENGTIFKVCAHVYGDEEKFKMFNEVIIKNLTISIAK